MSDFQANAEQSTFSLHRIGPIYASRYVISDQHLRYWTGLDWHVDQELAQKFYEPNEPLQLINKFILQEYGQLPVRSFSAPVEVFVWSDKPYSREELLAWLSKVARLIVNRDSEIGPVPHSFATLEIKWDSLREM